MPALVSAVVDTTADAKALVLTWGEALDDGSTPAVGDVSVSDDGTDNPVTAVEVDGSTVTLTLTNAEAARATNVTVSYTAGTSPIQDKAGNDAANLSSRAVTIVSGLPAVSIAADAETVWEGTAAAFTLSRTGATTAALTVTVKVTQTGAFLGEPVPAAAEFPPGDATTTLNVATQADDVLEQDGSVTATLTPGEGYTVGAAATASVTVLDDEVAVDVAVTIAETVAEGAGSLPITLTAATAEDQAPSARFWFEVLTWIGDANADDDFVPWIRMTYFDPEDFTRQAGDGNGARYVLTKELSVDIVDDAVVETDETFSVGFHDRNVEMPSWLTVDGADIGNGRVFEVTIEDDDEPAWDVSVDPPTIAEAGKGTSTVTVSTGAVTFADARTITLDFAGGTAAVTDDFTVTDSGGRALSSPYALTLAAGEAGVTAAITAVDDDDVDPGEEIAIAALLDGSPIGERQTIAITDDDAAAASDATLSALTLNGVTLDQQFDPATLTYTASVLHNVATTTVAATAKETGATVSIQPGDADGNRAGHQVDLSVGSTTIAVTVTARDGNTTKTYSVTVARTLRPVVSVKANPSLVTEGTPIRYTLTLSEAIGGLLPVLFQVEIEGEFSDELNARTGMGTVAIRPGSSTAVFDITPHDDAVVENRGAVTVTIRPAETYTVDSGADSARVVILDNDLPGPRFLSAETNTAGDAIVLTFTGPLDDRAGHGPPASAFGVRVHGQAIPVTGAAVSGAQATVILESPVGKGQQVEVRYADPTYGTDDEGALQGLEGDDLWSFSTDEVANRSTVTGRTPGPPSGLEARAHGQRAISVSWAAPSDRGGVPLSGYRIQVSDDGDSWSDLNAKTRTAHQTYVHEGLKSATTRHYRVAAINPAGTSGWSAAAMGTSEAAADLGTAVGGRTNAAGDKILIAFEEPVQNGSGLLDTATYRVELEDRFEIDATPRLVAPGSVARSGSDSKVVVLTLPAGSAVQPGHSVRVRFTRAVGGAELGHLPVINRVPDTRAPVLRYVSLAEEGKTVLLDYDEHLKWHSAGAGPWTYYLPSPGAFTVTMGENGETTVQVLSVTMSFLDGKQVRVNLSVPVDGTVKIGYADPSDGDDADAIQDHAGNDAVSFTDRGLGSVGRCRARCSCRG